MMHVHWPALIDALLEAVCLVEARTQRIVAANASAASLLQQAAPQLCGRLLSDFLDSPEDRHFWEQVAQTGAQPLESQTVLQRADGSALRVLRRLSPLPDADAAAPLYLLALQDLSQQQRTELQLELLLAELRATLESTADALLVCDLDGRIRAFNRRFAQLWDLPQHLLTQQDDAAIYAWLAGRVTDADAFSRRQNELVRAPLLEASDVWVLQSGRVLERVAQPQLARGRPIGRVHTWRDITERSATEAQLKLAAKVFESSLDAIFITDPQQRVLTCNPAAERLAAQTAASLNGCLASALFHSPHNDAWLEPLRAQLSACGFWEGELWHRRADQSLLALHVSWVVLRDAAGSALHNVVFAKDLSEKRAAQQRIEQLAYCDVLTGLPNRLTLGERVEHAIRLAQRNHKGFALLFLDLDRFKHINDSLGHLFGDKVLTEIAQRLKLCLRQVDTLCRMGGDEFVVHLHEADASGAEASAQRLIEAVVRPVEIEGMHFNLSCSVGIALYPDDGQTLDELIRHADTAMYQVKERGKGHYRFYRPEMNADLLARIQLDHAMREALQAGEFVLHYQPRLSVRGATLHSCEALLRWQRPGQGLLLPGPFIGVAEETGFIVRLGDWVLESAVRQAAQWAAQGLALPVAVNVSALQFHRADWVQRVADCLQRHALAPHLLELELTESILIRDAEEALGRLRALHALGVRLALDDFGTGFSSMSYLKRFPMQQIKIDRSFIATLHSNSVDSAIVAAIIRMGQALQMEVVAEGVELGPQLDLLHSLGCDLYQGFLCAPAISAAELEAALAQGRLRR